MVNFGVIASWKVRGSSVSRFEAWRARLERTDYKYPRDDSWWPAAATYGHAPAVAVSSQDSLSNITVSSSLTSDVDSSSMVPTGDVTVISTLLDVTRGLIRGYADLSRGYAMLGKMGNFEVQAQTYLVEDKWRYDEMGLGDNNVRRSLVVYHLPTASDTAYVQAATNLYYTFYFNPPYTAYLAPLWNDPDFIAYHWSPRDFIREYCTLPSPCTLETSSSTTTTTCPCVLKASSPICPCTLDTSFVDDRVQTLIVQIQGKYDVKPPIPGVAEQMTNEFIKLYNAMVIDYTNQLKAAKNDPNSSVNTAALQAEIKALNQEIATLQAFLKKLQNSNGS